MSKIIIQAGIVLWVLAACLANEESQFISQNGQEVRLVYEASIPAVGPNWFPTQWVPGAFSGHTRDGA
jgi:hypothetical protein